MHEHSKQPIQFCFICTFQSLHSHWREKYEDLRCNFSCLIKHDVRLVFVILLGLSYPGVITAFQHVMRGDKMLSQCHVCILNFHVVRLENNNGENDFDFSKIIIF